MSSTVLLTGSLYDLTRTPQDDVVTIQPIIPTGIEGIENFGVLDDGLVTPQAVAVAANSLGEFSVLLIPTSQTLAGADGQGMRYRLTVDVSSVEFSMPDGPPVRLSDRLRDRSTVPVLAPTARSIVYDQAKAILEAGANITLIPDDMNERINISSSGGGGSGGGGTTLPGFAQAAVLVLKSRANLLFWEDINEVPDTPGTTSGLGHVLTVTGENDQDYRWRPLSETSADPRIGRNATEISALQTSTANLRASLIDEETLRGRGDDIQSVTISTASSYQTTLNSQRVSDRPLLLVISATISGTRAGESYTWSGGDVLYIAPQTDDIEYWFNLGTDIAGLNQDQVDARVVAGVKAWARTGSGALIPENVIPASIARDTEVTAAVAAEATTRNTEIQAVETRIDNLAENEVRVVAVSGWDSGDNARSIQLAVYPPESIAGNVTLRFSVSGVALTANSGGGIDANGSVVSLPVNAANAGTLNRSAAREGYLQIDWIYGGDTYHGFIDYIPAPPTAGTSGLSREQVDARIAAEVADWAETGNTDDIPDGKIPSTITRDSELSSEAGARTNADAALGARIDSEAGARTNADAALGTRINNLASSRGLDQAAVDARITAGVLDWAETGNTSRLPDGKIPTAIARDSEVTSAISTETAARIAADGALGTRIDNIASAGGTDRTFSTFGLLTAASDTPVSGYTFTGYASAASAVLAVGSIAGAQQETIGGIYTATVRTSTISALQLIEQGKTYYAKPDTVAPAKNPLFVVIDETPFMLRGPFGTGNRFYEVIGIADQFFQSGATHRVQVIFTDGTPWILEEDYAALLQIETNERNSADTILGTRIDNLNPKIGRLVPINPWIRNDDAHVQLFAWFPLVAVARGAQLTVVVGGVTVRIQAPEAYAATDVDGLILSVAIDASNSATITRSANMVAGHVRADLSMGDNDFHCYICLLYTSPSPRDS